MYDMGSPGAAVTLLPQLWAVGSLVALAVAAMLFWPVRVLLRRRPRRVAAARASAAQ